MSFTPTLVSVWAWIGIGYLLGSIPFGLLLTRAAGLGDIRKIGSGNIGTTNVLRTGRKGLAAATLILDAGKGALAVGLALSVHPNAALLAGAAAFIGHIFPVWLWFRGGKGVATYLGVLLALLWPAGVIALIVWVGAAAITRYSSLGGILSAIAGPVAAIGFDRWDVAVVAIAMGFLLILKHEANLERLFKGEEPKIGR